MRLNINAAALKLRRGPAKDPRAGWKIALIALAVANLIAFGLLMRPLGGTVEELNQRLRDLRTQIRLEQQQLLAIRANAQKIEKARRDQVQFMQSYFMDRRTLSSTVLSELESAAKEAGLKAKEHSFTVEPVEGTDNLSLMTITGNYEGNYGDLIRYVNRLDRSKRFLILDNIQAAPMQQAGVLASRFRINAFVREGVVGPALPPPPAPPAPATTGKPEAPAKPASPAKPKATPGPTSTKPSSSQPDASPAPGAAPPSASPSPTPAKPLPSQPGLSPTPAPSQPKAIPRPPVPPPTSTKPSPVAMIVGGTK